ncbi:MAG: nucleotidyltransferase family protein [marine benthic group bacterium]|jgi:molybdenum cofactor cytidylyltransferase|nr:nucleotidyltransferase family protein [Gemmatimonadota bacterium]MCL7937340.1 nucleotidyltransferase family protein [Gemmatimonadota bacterium]MCL7973154.1 nucleotidyltransferase family protein [Gemmatimonadota bacterium]
MQVSENRGVAGLVLAAGASSRMPGTTKLLQPWGEGVVIEAVIESARRAGLAPIYVVVGADAPRLESRLTGSGVITISHDLWNLGRFSTLGTGLAAARRSDDTECAVILLGDEPGMRAGTIRSVVSTWLASGAELVRARYRDRPGHPVLVAREAWDLAIETSALPDDSRSNWERLCSLGLDAREVAVDAPAPIDVDDPAALARARSRSFDGEPCRSASDPS